MTQDEDVTTGVCCGVGGVRMLRVCGARFSQSRRHRSKVGQFKRYFFRVATGRNELQGDRDGMFHHVQ